MDEESLPSHLSRIATQWTVLRQAHGSTQDEARRAQAAMFERYQRAVYSYLMAALRNPDAADEVFQQFALKFLRGGFRGADPQRGRFRGYLKTALIRLIVDYRRKAGSPIASLDAGAAKPQGLAAEADEGEAFDRAWRDELLRRVWHALERYEQASGHPFHAVLRYRTEHPGQSSEEMAAGLTEQLAPERPFNSAGTRKTLQRAREKFADLLLDEVAASLQRSDLEAIEAELVALELHPYCRSGIQRRRKSGGKPGV